MIWNITGMFLNIVVLYVGICKKTDTLKPLIFFLYYIYKLSIQLKVKEALGYDFISKVGRFLIGLKLSVGLHTIVALMFSLLKYVFMKFVIMDY